MNLADEFNHEAARAADAVVLAVKPTVARAVLTEEQMSKVLKNDVSLLISIAAGVRISTFQKWLSSSRISLVRCMPNTPSLLGLGAIGIYASEKTPKHHRDLSEVILSAVSAPGGGLVWVDREELLDAVTAVSGSGPAYHFYLTELIEQEGIRLGLDKLTARKLAIFTAFGSATMMVNQCLESPENPNAILVDPEQLRKRVTSPNGTTNAAILSLQKDGLATLVRNALEACNSRARDIGDELEGQ
ncbi:hypothetical protein L0F63_001416 [Massospora cicadina]|nr:hypothetical protein L0F63_001416 [Massospora cicadina]